MRTVRLGGGAGVSVRLGDDAPSSSDTIVHFTDTTGQESKTIATKVTLSKDYGTSSTQIDLIDVNGDGLLDQARKSSSAELRVRLNRGYGFGPEIVWTDQQPWTVATYGGLSLPGGPNVFDTSTDVLRMNDNGADSVGGSGSVGGQSGSYGGSFGLGGGWVYNVSRTIVDTIDVNGDGLPDQLLKPATNGTGDSTLYVRLNQGTTFGPEQPWHVPGWGFNVDPAEYLFLGSGDALAFQHSETWNGSGSLEVCYWIVCANISVFYATGDNWSQGRLEDIDGDGFVDQVLKIDGDPLVYVKENQLGKVNRLATVMRPLGASFEIDYTHIGNHVDRTHASHYVDMPHGHWVMSQVSVVEPHTARGTRTPSTTAPSIRQTSLRVPWIRRRLLAADTTIGVSGRTAGSHTSLPCVGSATSIRRPSRRATAPCWSSSTSTKTSTTQGSCPRNTSAMPAVM